MNPVVEEFKMVPPVRMTCVVVGKNVGTFRDKSRIMMVEAWIANEEKDGYRIESGMTVV